MMAPPTTPIGKKVISVKTKKQRRREDGDKFGSVTADKFGSVAVAHVISLHLIHPLLIIAIHVVAGRSLTLFICPNINSY